MKGGNQKLAADRRELSSRDIYWYKTLKFSHLGPLPGAIDTQSGLPMTAVLEVLRGIRFCGPGAMPQADWSVHRNMRALHSCRQW